MPRHKDFDWDLPEGCPNSAGGTSHSWESIHASLLMDIRDELRKLNGLLYCPNFTGMPAELRKVARNTAKPRKARTSK